MARALPRAMCCWRLTPFTYDNQLADARAAERGKSRAERAQSGGQARATRKNPGRSQRLKKAQYRKRHRMIRSDETIKAARASSAPVVDRIHVQVKKAKRDLANTKVVAPFSGYVANINAPRATLLNPE